MKTLSLIDGRTIIDKPKHEQQAKMHQMGDK